MLLVDLFKAKRKKFATMTEYQREYHHFLVPEWNPLPRGSEDDQSHPQNEVNLVKDLVFFYTRDNVLVVDIFFPVSTVCSVANWTLIATIMS